MITPTISTVSTLSEIPEVTYNALQAFLDLHPDWDSNRFMSTAIELLLKDCRSSDVLSIDSIECDRIPVRRSLIETESYKQFEKQMISDPELRKRFLAEMDLLHANSPNYGSDRVIFSQSGDAS